MMPFRRPKRMRLQYADETLTGARVFRGPDGVRLEICWRDWVNLGKPTGLEIEISDTSLEAVRRA